MSLQLLVNSQGSDCLEAKEKVHVIGNRLKLLLKEVTRDLRELAKILDITSSQQVDMYLLTAPAVLCMLPDLSTSSISKHLIVCG